MTNDETHREEQRPEGEEQRPEVERLEEERPPEGVGWLLRPTTDEITFYVEGVEEAEDLTPDLQQAIERRIAERFQRISLEAAAPVAAKKPCASLRRCDSYDGKCPNLAACGCHNAGHGTFVIG